MMAPLVAMQQPKNARAYRHAPYAHQASSQDSGSDDASQFSNSVTPRSTAHRNSGSMPIFEASTTSLTSAAPTPTVSPSAKNQAPSTTLIVVSEEEFNRNVGNLKRLAFTAPGSSLIQAAMRQHGTAANDAVVAELSGHMDAMLMDNHACYVAKLMIEKMPQRARDAVLSQLSGNEQLWVSMCTRSLHSRRMVQFFLDTFGIDSCAFLVLLVQRHFHTIAMSKEGCVTVQRILDVCGHGVREIFFTFIRCNFVAYACDIHATYVVQYMMRFGDANATVDGIVEQLRGGNAAVLCGNKYASPVLEKCIAALGARFQVAMVQNIFQCMPDEMLCALLNDNYANYVVQALIDNCDAMCLDVIAQRIQNVLPLVQYGRKLLLRIQKRAQAGYAVPKNTKKW
jgi:hypothetical protein